jgi:ATP-dependent Lhr-like helicase
MSMKTDLIPPERMRAVLIESAKARLLNETSSFLCTNCWSYTELMRVKDLPDKPKCPKCGSLAIGLLKVEEEKALAMAEKGNEKLTKNEEKLHNQALQTAQLIEKYGKVAAVALSARRIQPTDVRAVLEKESKLNDRFYELVIEEEREAMSKRFW